MSTRKKLFVTVCIAALMGAVVFGTFAAFTATSTNAGNKIDSGTVKIDDDSATSTPLYNGSLGAAVKIYASAGITNGADYNLKIERGTGLTTITGLRSCAGFVSVTTPYDGNLGSFATDYAGGVDGKALGAAWAQNDTVDYRFTITQKDDATPNAHTAVKSSGTHSFTWEAQNN